MDREHAHYQYALFCSTRLAEKYMSNMFPDVRSSLVQFCAEQRVEYFTLTNELYNALSFPERLLKNCEVDAAADSFAKEAIGELTRMYMRNDEFEAEERTLPDVTHLSPQLMNDGGELAEFETFYEDTLKMIITDIEKRDVWQKARLICNQASDYTYFELFFLYVKLLF